MFGAPSPAFEPTAVQTMADALDQAWAVMEGTGTVTPQHRLETRLALANRIIELTSYGEYNTSVLRDAALASMTEQHASALQHSSAASATPIGRADTPIVSLIASGVTALPARVSSWTVLVARRMVRGVKLLMVRCWMRGPRACAGGTV
jgi:hypothetical protein